MPILKGEFAKGKPIVNVGLAPVLPRPGQPTPVAEPSVFPITPLRALLDTGADGTSITASVARRHRLENRGLRPVVGVGGSAVFPTWITFLGFFFDQDADFEGDNHTSTGLFILPDPLLTVEISDNEWFDVIIGRDVLEKFEFLVRKGKWELHLA